MFKILKENVLDKAAAKANSETFHAGFMAVPLRRLMTRTDISFAELGVSHSDFESWFFGNYQKDTTYTRAEWETQFQQFTYKVFLSEKGVDYTALNDRTLIATEDGTIFVENSVTEVYVDEHKVNLPKVEKDEKSTDPEKSTNSSPKVQSSMLSSKGEEDKVLKKLQKLRKEAEKLSAQQQEQQIEERRWMERLVSEARKVDSLMLQI